MILSRLKELVGAENVLTNEPMKQHTTFRIGGPADYFVTPEEAGQVGGVRDFCREEQIPCFVMGNGSNLLVRDGGIRGVVLQIGRNYRGIAVDGTLMRVQAGEPLAAASRAAAQAGLRGLEFASGIPGTVGGAAFMNAGAYGGEMKDVLRSARILADGEIRSVGAEEMELGYRSSAMMRSGAVVLDVTMELTAGDPEEIRAYMEDLKEKRAAKQPLEYPSAGSTFKRPEGYFAGKLIQDAGLRGYQVGQAQVSEKHCGFVINRGGASAADVLALIGEIRERVHGQFGVWLEPEIRIIGEAERT